MKYFVVKYGKIKNIDKKLVSATKYFITKYGRIKKKKFGFGNEIVRRHLIKKKNIW